MKPKARKTGILSENLDGEAIVYDLDRDKAHLLNESVTIVWEASDGTRDVDALAEELALHTGLPADASIVRLALAELSQADLLEGEMPPASLGALSRRDLIARLGPTVAGIAIALPLIRSVTAPTPAMAQSTTTTTTTLPADNGSTIPPI